MIDTYSDMDATALAALVASGDVAADELLDSALDVMSAKNPGLNAVVITFEDHARAAIARGLPDGPFRGVPFLLKDLDVTMAGTPMHNGSALYPAWVPEQDSTIVQRYKAAGLVIFGRTNTSELGLCYTTDNPVFGPTKHPLDPALSPGGSSGGSASAVAAGIVPMAHATDGGGSIRYPAALTGLFGLKPSRGRTPPGPHLSEIFFGMAIGHALTRSVRDSAALLDATQGTETGALHPLPAPDLPFAEHARRDPRPLRIALQRAPFNDTVVDPACLDALDRAVALCTALGHEIVETAPDMRDIDFAGDFRLLCGAFTSTFAKGAPGAANTDDPIVQLAPAHAQWVREAAAQPADQLIMAHSRMQEVARRYAHAFTGCDMILSPVTGQARLPLNHLSPFELDADTLLARVANHAPFTFPYNAAGCPAMSINFPDDDCFPIGIQFAAAVGREDILFQLAGQLERARDLG